MGRNAVRIRIDAKEFRKTIKSRGIKWAEIADFFGITKQAVSNWLSEERISPRTLFEIAMKWQIPSEEVNLILMRSAEENLKEEQRQEFEVRCKAIIEWLNQNTNPHAKVVITTVGAELLYGQAIFTTEEFLKD